MVKKRLLAATLSLGIITPIATSFHESKADNNIENIGDSTEVVKRTEDTSSDKWGSHKIFSLILLKIKSITKTL